MAEVVWSPSALEDIDYIAEDIPRDSPDRAALYIFRLREVIDNLKEFPYSGRIIAEIGDELCREIIYYSYRIMYRVEEDEIWITDITYGARDWKPRF